MSSERVTKRCLSRNVSFSDEEDVLYEVRPVEPERKSYVWYKKEEIDRFRLEEQFRAERKTAKRLRKLILNANNTVASAAEKSAPDIQTPAEKASAEESDMIEIPFFSISAEPNKKWYETYCLHKFIIYFLLWLIKTQGKWVWLLRIIDATFVPLELRWP